MSTPDSPDIPDQTADTADTADPDAPEAPVVRRGRGLVVVCALLAVALVAALVCVGVLWRQRERTDDLAESGRQAEAAARSAVISLTTYSYSTVDDDFAWVDTAATSDLQTYFKEVSVESIALIKQLKADAKSKVVDSAVRVEDTDQVTVLLFVDQEITTEAETPVPAAPSIDQPRVTMSMVRQDGAWLVDEVSVNKPTDQ